MNTSAEFWSFRTSPPKHLAEGRLETSADRNLLSHDLRSRQRVMRVEHRAQLFRHTAHLVEILSAARRLTRPVIMLLNSDEEVGSTASRPLTEKLAAQCESVFVLEPAQGLACKTARKGVGDYHLQVTGVAAHSGVDFERGHSAVLELARLEPTGTAARRSPGHE